MFIPGFILAFTISWIIGNNVCMTFFDKIELRHSGRSDVIKSKHLLFRIMGGTIVYQLCQNQSRLRRSHVSRLVRYIGVWILVVQPIHQSYCCVVLTHGFITDLDHRDDRYLQGI